MSAIILCVYKIREICILINKKKIETKMKIGMYLHNLKVENTFFFFFFFCFIKILFH